MRFLKEGKFPSSGTGRIFIAEHGPSSIYSASSGYRITSVDINIPNSYEVFIEGWLTNQMSIWGRPTDIEFLPDGSMLISDDFANAIYRVAYTNRNHKLEGWKYALIAAGIVGFFVIVAVLVFLIRTRIFQHSHYSSLPDHIPKVGLFKMKGTKSLSKTHVCQKCGETLGPFTGKRNCRKCGGGFCRSCATHKVILNSTAIPVRVCNDCYIESISV